MGVRSAAKGEGRPALAAVGGGGVVSLLEPPSEVLWLKRLAI